MCECMCVCDVIVFYISSASHVSLQTDLIASLFYHTVLDIVVC